MIIPLLILTSNFCGEELSGVAKREYIISVSLDQFLEQWRKKNAEDLKRLRFEYISLQRIMEAKRMAK